MKLHVETSYVATAIAEIDVPFDEWYDVEEWYIKWNVLHYKLYGEDEYRQHDLGDPDPESLDVKNPGSIFIAGVSHDGNVIDDAPYVDC